ncbi:MAG: hypothetical protein ACK5WC_16960 [Aphanizomenon sp.]|jgi:hypothetical protein|uniref:DUF7305 domain-containing protein n=1 Tax=Aphanizomenon flos-aquae LD13 TaxID=1710894 RepID=A0A1B7VYM1_APHFL|nr:hypothetical protein [Aphanizomenon flos-aquae UKL13-PB]OBQ26080.1 MAG: hypothetical protein AN481_06865 [Aphanizomenon flos-aquae LD13]HCQ22588.1 hypothetical protein [Anabaena sp. UBA12330]
MYSRLKLALIQHRGEKGFASVLAIGIGLVMMLIGLTMAIRSRNDVALSSTQGTTSKALSAAEVGISRYQYLLNSVRVLAQYPNTATSPNASWSNPTAIPSYSSCSSRGNIPNNTIIGTYATTDWQNIDSKTQFKLVSYTYADAGAGINPPAGTLLGTGTLTVQGRVNIAGSGNNATNTSSTSTAQLQVKIPVKQTDPNTIPVPGVWVSNGGTGGNGIAGNVFVNDCTTNLGSINIDNSGGNSYAANYITLSLPNIPSVPSGSINLGALSNTTVTLPRTGTPTDIATTFNGNSGVYVYEVSNISKATINITLGQKVVIFLSGNLDKQTNINHNCTGYTGTPACIPTDFQIFGTGAAGSTIDVNGGNLVDGFILAPNYEIGVNGGAGGTGGFRGAIWAKDWGNGGGTGSNTSNTVVQQTATWSSIGLSPQNLPPYIDAFSSWKKQAVQ